MMTKKQQRKKNGKNFIISVRLTEDQFTFLETWKERQAVPPTIPEIVRIALLRWIREMDQS